MWGLAFGCCLSFALSNFNVYDVTTASKSVVKHLRTSKSGVDNVDNTVTVRHLYKREPLHINIA